MAYPLAPGRVSYEVIRFEHSADSFLATCDRYAPPATSCASWNHLIEVSKYDICVSRSGNYLIGVLISGICSGFLLLDSTYGNLTLHGPGSVDNGVRVTLHMKGDDMKENKPRKSSTLEVFGLVFLISVAGFVLLNKGIDLLVVGGSELNTKLVEIQEVNTTPRLPRSGATAYGTIDYVVDGDTVDIKFHDGSLCRVRLLNRSGHTVRCSELNTNSGLKASEFMEQFTGRRVQMYTNAPRFSVGAYGRVLAGIRLTGAIQGHNDLANLLYTNGHAK